MTNEERVQYNKKDNYTYEEVRKMIESALEDRARYLGFFYKVMPVSYTHLDVYKRQGRAV